MDLCRLRGTLTARTHWALSRQKSTRDPLCSLAQRPTRLTSIVQPFIAPMLPDHPTAHPHEPRPLTLLIYSPYASWATVCVETARPAAPATMVTGRPSILRTVPEEGATAVAA